MSPKYLILLLLFPLSLFAQKKSLKLDKIVDGSLKPQALPQLQWRGNTDFVSYTNGKDKLVQASATDDPQVLLTLEGLNKKLEAYSLALAMFPEINWHNDSVFTFWMGNSLFSYDLHRAALKDVAHLEKGAENMDVSANLDVVYTVGNNIWVHHNGGNHALSKDGDRQIEYGKATHRWEFGIDKGTFWSPKGGKVAFYRTDHSDVTDYPLTDFTHIPARNHAIKYPMAGQKSHVATLGIYDIISGKTIYVETGQPADQYLTNISWHPDGTRIYIALVNRAQNKMMLNEYSAQNGAFVQTLFEEENEKYVEPEHGLFFVPGKDDQFLWLSERDGYNHLYLYKTNGHLIRQLTQGQWEITDFEGFSGNGTKAFFMATEQSPLERHLYSVNVSGLPLMGNIKQLTHEDGVHEVILSGRGNQLLDSYSNRIVPFRTQIIQATNGQTQKRLWEAPNPLKEFEMGNIEIFSLRADDGTKLYSRMITPADFDSSQTYPAIVYVYGGPHIQLIDESWLGDSRDLLFLHYLAHQGYIVFALDNRGSAFRGLEFEQALFRQMGTVELSDQMKGINYLKHLSYVDNDRIGVYGGSYGGFMTLSLMLKQADVFKVGVARGPVTDWKFYEVMYTERYMDTPKENPGGYLEASLLNHAGKLKGKLLIIQGMQDSTVVPQHSMAFVRACVEQHVELDFFPYNRHAHSVRGKDRVDFYQRIAKYFEDNL